MMVILIHHSLNDIFNKSSELCSIQKALCSIQKNLKLVFSVSSLYLSCIAFVFDYCMTAVRGSHLIHNSCCYIVVC